ncbi:MAG: hypothetical protein JW789_02190, partial [Candidatus Aenigmarchaeota archaeon]|nr:hypothetical protein [Candidatus Aenigmarchaeota archaeon]
GEKTCTVTDDYQNGMCHVCGDGINDAVETSENCCQDAGCTGNMYCDDASKKCLEPNCKNGNCEPTEDSSSCAYDCWATEGKTCQDTPFDATYYYDGKGSCIKAVCPNNICEWEAGENAETCCSDCKVEYPCPEGQYCNVTKSLPKGRCTDAECGNSVCETEGGETYESCCDDCACPVDSKLNVLMECDGICHLCGNSKVEILYENEGNCCVDTGCSEEGDFCSTKASCEHKTEMEMSVSIIPSQIDCTLADSVPQVKFTPVSMPYKTFLNSYEKVTYTYGGGLYRLDNCKKEGDAYVCDFPLSFQGCFEEPGVKNVDFTITVKYFEDEPGMRIGELKYNDISASLGVDVIKTKQRVCVKDGACNTAIGENVDVCCWDCGCSGDDTCTSGGCKDESLVTLYTTPDYLPAGKIDCRPKDGHQTVDTFTFTAKIENLPESSKYGFRILSKKIEYNGKNYTASNMPGFDCTALTAQADGVTYHTGEVECTVPVAYFPACPDPIASGDDGAPIKLHLNVLGGGLRMHYNTIEGKTLSTDTFYIDYIQGNPKCGDGVKDPSLGESQNTCCQDFGCEGFGGDYDNEYVCTSAGCKMIVDIAIDASIDPKINCAGDDELDETAKTVSLTLEMNYYPFSPETNGVILGQDVYISGHRIGEMGGQCIPTTDNGWYEWTCTIPTNNFNPFCWEAGPANETVWTSLKWKERDSSSYVNIVRDSDISFEINPARDRKCNHANGCESNLGEDTLNCCTDCGCKGTDQICTIDNKCVDENAVDITVTSVKPATGIDCSSPATDDNNVEFFVEINNEPDDVQLIRWYIDYKGETYNEQYFTCKQELDYFGQPSGGYVCTMPVYHFPGCAEDDDSDVNLAINAYIRVLDKGQSSTMNANKDFTVHVSKGGTPMCGDSSCQEELGETTDNCCQDCGCGPSGDICVVGRKCVSQSELTLEIRSSETENARCQLIPGKVEDYVIKNYGCEFDEPLQLEAELMIRETNEHVKPVNAQISKNKYRWTYTLDDNGQMKDKSERPQNTMVITESAFGWTIDIRPNPGLTYIVDRTKANANPATDTFILDDFQLTIQSSTPRGYSNEFTVTSGTGQNDKVVLNVDLQKNDDLLEYEKVFKDIKDAIDKANKKVCNIVFVLATCVMCSLMAGGVDADTAKGLDKLGDKTPGEIAGQDSSLSDIFVDPNDKEASKGISIPYAGGGGFGNIHPQMFQKIMGTLSDSGDAASAIISGGIALVGFGLVANQMLDCSDGYFAKLAGAAVFCGALLYASPNTLVRITKMCDALATAVKLIDMLSTLQRDTLDYQVCMMSAETAMARSQSTSTNGYDVANMASRYYQMQSACHKGMSQNMQQLMYQYDQFSYQMSASTNWAGSGYTVYPQPIDGSHIFKYPIAEGLDKKIVVQYNIPQSTGTSMPTSSSYNPWGYSSSRYSSTMYPSYYSSSNYYPSNNYYGSSYYNSNQMYYPSISVIFAYNYYNGEQPVLSTSVTKRQSFSLSGGNGQISCTMTELGPMCSGAGQTSTSNPLVPNACPAGKTCSSLKGDIIIETSSNGVIASYMFESA